jgi:serine-type D-Ala-D-Ala carboxypeptidase/endopeptidase (penicillin-binding protein 4)
VRRSITASIVAAAAAAFLVAAPTATVTPVAADPQDQLTSDLDTILDRAGYADGQASVMVSEVDGDVLYAKGDTERLMPASNQKLLTSAAAMDVLGPDYRFATSVLGEGQQRGSTWRGDLYLRGQGDPTMLASDYDELAAQVAAAGIRKVSGRLVADDTFFDDTRYGDSWSWDYLDDYYASALSALTVAPDTDYDAGTVILEISPGAAAGDPARVKVVPETSYVKVVNQATTKASGSTSLSANRLRIDSNVITVEGSIAVGAATSKNWVALWEPTGYAADVFRRALARHGVQVYGRTTYAATPADAKSLAEHQSMPLSEILIPFMKLSNNGHAEVLLKTMGRKASNSGTWSAGIAAMTPVLQSYGVDTAKLRIRDGSGLTRMDVVPARQVNNLLIGVRGRPWFQTWYDALPIAGVSDRMVGGTLRSRMVGSAAAGNVHAKTGSLTGVTALSGYVTDKDGQPLVFSILHNNFVTSPRPAEDEIAIRLANYTRTEGAAVQPLRKPNSKYGPSDVECSWVKSC